MEEVTVDLVGTGSVVVIAVLGAMDLGDTVDLTPGILVDIEDIAVLVGADLVDITAIVLITGVFTTGTMKSLKRMKTLFLPLVFSLDLALGL